jgi:putative peptidoglycan lipid II flippase
MFLLRSSLNRRIGRTGLAPAFVAALWTAAAVGAAAGWGVKLALPSVHPVITAIAVLGTYGVVFLGVAFALRVPEVRIVRRFL